MSDGYGEVALCLDFFRSESEMTGFGVAASTIWRSNE
jgi:hypothetical protein